MLERLCGEGRRRTSTKLIGRFPNEGSCLSLFFATLLAASQSWRGIHMTPAMLPELRELKSQLYRNKAGSEDEVPSVAQPSRRAS